MNAHAKRIAELEAELAALKAGAAASAAPTVQPARDASARVSSRQEIDDQVVALYGQGKRDGEIAAALGSTEGAIGVRLVRLRREGRVGRRDRRAMKVSLAPAEQARRDERDARIIALVAAMTSNAAIAADVGMSEKGLEKHLKRLRKAGVLAERPRGGARRVAEPDPARRAYDDRLIALYEAGHKIAEIATEVGKAVAQVSMQLTALRRKGRIGRRRQRHEVQHAPEVLDAAPPAMPAPTAASNNAPVNRGGRPSDNWAPQSIAELRRLWDLGYTLNQIGAALGISRNAVVGKARRLGLKARGTPIIRKANPVEPAVKKARPVPKQVAPRPHEVAKRPEVAKRTGLDPDDAYGLKGCQWLDGDVPRKTVVRELAGHNHGFQKVESRTFGKAYACWAEVPRCGNPRLEKSAYCPDHHAICWTPAPRSVNTGQAMRKDGSPMGRRGPKASAMGGAWS